MTVTSRNLQVITGSAARIGGSIIEGRSDLPCVNGKDVAAVVAWRLARIFLSIGDHGRCNSGVAPSRTGQNCFWPSFGHPRRRSRVHYETHSARDG